jgi:hypothetical protein
VYTPLAAVFDLVPLGLSELAMLAPYILVPFAAIELGKYAIFKAGRSKADRR